MSAQDYESVIGLEIHVQLNTRSKLFCHCDNDSSTATPNEHTCPICTGQPGYLPLTNEVAVEKAMRFGLALGCRIPEKSVFDRKNYFYPDSPLGYQITQLHYPIALDGQVEVWLEESSEPHNIRVNRVHLESDAGKLVHHDGKTYTDWNRCGTPLVEIVTEPDLSSAAEAKAFFENVRAITRYVNVSGGDMEKGHLRCDANISLKPKGSEKMGTRTEVKNLNSFRAVEAAINFEIERQAQILDKGGKVTQETRGWDDMQKITIGQRGKEEAHDYRYFPEPDLPPLYHDPAIVEKLQAEQPEFPVKKRKRFVSNLGLSAHDAWILALDFDLAQFFEAATAICNDPKQVARWLLTEHFGRLSKAGQKFADTKFRARDLGEMINLIKKGEISSKIGKDVFDEMFTTGESPDIIIRKHGWKQVSDSGELEKTVDEVLTENPEVVEKFKGGDERVLGFFIGQVMKKTGGQANPGLVNEILRERLKS